MLDRTHRIPVHVVVALMAEGRPFVEAWGLESREREPFRIFEREDRRLVVSGIGGERSAAAVRHLGRRTSGPAVWLNVGVCGHATLPLGNARAVHRIVEAATGRAWYPPAVAPWPWPSVDLHTVTRPQLDYSEEVAYDMEAAAFVAEARELATAELVQVVKIVSDNRENPPRRFRPAEVADLVRPHVPAITELAEALGEVASGLTSDPIDEALYQEILVRGHFSVTRRRQLRELLRRTAALDIPIDPEELPQEAGAIVETIRRALKLTRPAL